MKRSLIFLLLTVLLFSCLDQEGEGGTSTVHGYIYKVLHHDDVLNFDTDTFPAAKTDVYIIYGDEAVYSDKMETTHDGFFQFRYLTKGTYTIYAFNSYPDGRKEAVYDTVFVSRGGIATTDDLYIHEGKMLDKSYIKGTLLARYYNKDIPVSDYVPAYGERVYIRKKGAPFTKAYDGKFLNIASKSASIVTKMKDNRPVVATINGKYWMYWGEKFVKLAWSENLIDWYPLLDENGNLKELLSPRAGFFDSGLTECGPPAFI